MDKFECGNSVGEGHGLSEKNHWLSFFQPSKCVN